ncbi:hypothetical protein BH09PAT4_BH09PAT4_06040 [soil metagenome]
MSIDKQGVELASEYRKQGVALGVLRAAGVDFTGDKVDEEGNIVRETSTEAVVRMAETIRSHHPDGIDLLRQAGIEV